jgi:xanthine dehydrogenase molybdopterin-binding subunit B
MRASAAYRLETASNMLLRYFAEMSGEPGLGAGGAAMSVQKPLPHDAAPLHVTGAARYVDDIPVPQGCLHLAFGLSKVAKGRLVKLDLTAVAASEGVHLVLAGTGFRHDPRLFPLRP